MRKLREENDPRNLYLGVIGIICGICAAYLFGIIGYFWAGADLFKKTVVLLGQIVAFLAGGLGLPAFVFMDPELVKRRAWMLYALIVLTLLVGFVRGEWEDRREAARSAITNAPSPRTATPEAVASRQREAEDKWLADIDEAAAHGASNAQPPMLAVRDDGKVVSIRNLSDLKIQCVRIRRANAQEPGLQAPACDLQPDGLDCAPLEPGASLTYSLSGAESCARLPLEFRVGDVGHPEPTWWSDSALKSWRDARDAVEADGVAHASVGQEADAVALGALLDQYESQLHDASRSIRWREEHAEWAQLKAEVLAFERGPDEQAIASAWQNVDRAKFERITALLAAGSHGPPGTIPHYVRVSVVGERTIMVDNTSADSVNIIVSRPRTRAGPREDAHCLFTGPSPASNPSAFLLPGRTADLYFMYPEGSTCWQQVNMLLEFQIDSGNELVWITDSRVHLYLDLAPEYVDDLRKRVRAANRAASRAK